MILPTDLGLRNTYIISKGCYMQFANPTTYYLEWVLALLKDTRPNTTHPAWSQTQGCPVHFHGLAKKYMKLVDYDYRTGNEINSIEMLIIEF